MTGEGIFRLFTKLSSPSKDPVLKIYELPVLLFFKETIMTKGFGNLIKQAQQLQSKMMKVQEEMAGRTAEAAAGGGMVVAVANGKQELVSIKIEKEVVNPEDVEMLQDLVVAAVNAALKTAQEMVAEEMKKLTGGINIPGMM
jgi:hypothetical protein